MELVDLETFKIKKCDKQHPAGLSNCHLECPFYHSRDDKRRSPLSATKTSLVYSHTYLEDFYSTQMASNLVEHLFHPDVYKTINCTSRFTKNFEAIGGKKTQECRVKWCPYLHKKEDVSSLAKYRGLQMLVPLEEPLCLKLEQADHLNILLKGTNASIQA